MTCPTTTNTTEAARCFHDLMDRTLLFAEGTLLLTFLMLLSVVLLMLTLAWLEVTRHHRRY